MTRFQPIGAVLLFITMFLAACGGPQVVPPTVTLSPFPPASTTATFTPRPTSTPTPKPGAQWEGEWKVYVNGNEGEWEGEADFEVSGKSFSGSFSLYSTEVRGLNYIMAGTFDDDYMLIRGTWELIDGGNGTFTIKMDLDRSDQFAGNMDAGKFKYQFCGWRSQSTRPSPCGWP